jgi:hypothetical protein
MSLLDNSDDSLSPATDLKIVKNRLLAELTSSKKIQIKRALALAMLLCS